MSELPTRLLLRGTAAALALVLAAGIGSAVMADDAVPPADVPGATAAAPVQATATDETIAVIEIGADEQRFTIEIADTPDERAKGLMFRQEMAANAGMLFDYGSDQDGVAFWMKNTPLPLDMIFIREDGTITQIAADTIPFSLEPIPSREPVRFVLEVNAGTAGRLGITPGDRLRHPRIVAP